MSTPQYNHDGSALRVWKGTEQNTYLTAKAGRPLFDEVTYVEVTSPGSSGSCPTFEVRREFHPDFAETMNDGKPLYGPHWERFKKYVEDFDANEAGQAGDLAGTALSEWSQISRSDAASLAANGIHTVEAIAHLPDGKVSLLGPNGRELQAQAVAYLAASTDIAHVTALAAENEVLKADKLRLEGEVAELSKRIGEYEKLAAEAGTEKPADPLALPVEKPAGAAKRGTAAVVEQPIV